MNNREDFLEQFYEALASDDENRIKKLNIPHSSVFYARAAYEAATGNKCSLRQMETAMRLEGLLWDSYWEAEVNKDLRESMKT